MAYFKASCTLTRHSFNLFLFTLCMLSKKLTEAKFLVCVATLTNQVYFDSGINTAHSSCTVALIPPWQWLTGVCRANGNSVMGHMGVPPSCHVHLPMSPLWLRWRWQKQSGACQSNRKGITHCRTHPDGFPLPDRNNPLTLSLSAPPVSSSAVINLPNFQYAMRLPLVPTPLTGDSH